MARKNLSQLSLYQHTHFFVLVLVIIITLLPGGSAAVTWQDYTDVLSGEISVCTGPNLIDPATGSQIFNQAFTATTSGANSLSAIGVTTFQIPPTTDFSIITNRTTTATNLQLTVYLLDDTVIWYLKVNYIIMARNNDIYHLTTSQLYPSKLNESAGYRSEYDVVYINTTTYPIYASTTIASVFVLEGFRVLNSDGSYLHLDGIVHFPSSGVINTTFITSECSLVYYIKYSVLLFDATASDIQSYLVFQLGYSKFYYDDTVATTFFTNILSRYQQNERMFFGMSSFNFTKSTIKQFSLDTTNYANMESTYTLSNIANLTLTYYFFVQRNCPGGQFFYNNWDDPTLDDCVGSCSGYNDRPTDDATYDQCVACHITCVTCNTNSASACLTCNATMFRVMNTASPSTCDCMTNYVPSGGAWCQLCSTYMTGCRTCSSTSTCTSCITGFVGTTNCVCLSGSIISGFCNTVYGCITISEINSTQTCTTCNTSLLLELSASFMCVCITGTTTLPDQSCDPICGDDYVLAIEGCDDGNVVDGDGCSSTCTVETNWSCVGVFSQGSTCKINITISLNYIGALRDTSTNRGDLYFTLTPYFDEFLKVDYNTLISTDLPYSSISAVYGSTEQMLKMTVDYTKTIENQQYYIQLWLQNTDYFWNASSTISPTLKGINAELTFDQKFWIHNGMKYVAYVIVVGAILVFIASVFVEKWIGLELIQTYQTIFFLFTLGRGYAFELTAIIEIFINSNGYSEAMQTDYEQSYTMPDNLVGVGIQKQFMNNYNLTYLLMVLALVIVVIVGLVLKYFKSRLEESLSSEVKANIEQTERVFSFMVSRVFLMIIFFSMFKIIFSLVIQMGNDQTVHQTIADELNVLAAILAFGFVCFGLSYVVYWYIFLPNNYEQSQEFLCLNFQKMSLRYPIAYLFYQLLIILTISLVDTESYTIYLVLGFQVAYLILIIFYRPYNEVYKINRMIHNGTIIFNQCLLIFEVIVIIKWNDLYNQNNYIESNTEMTAYFLIIFISAILALALAIFRLVIFNTPITGNCCKKEPGEDFNELPQEKGMMKQLEQERFGEYMNKMNKTGSRNVEMMPTRRKNISVKRVEDEKQQKQDSERQRIKEDVERNKRKDTNQDVNFDQTVLNSFLNQEYSNWNRDKSKPKPKRVKTQLAYSNVKKTSNRNNAQLEPTSLELYQEMLSKRNNNNGLTRENRQDNLDRRSKEEGANGQENKLN